MHLSRRSAAQTDDRVVHGGTMRRGFRQSLDSHGLRLTCTASPWGVRPDYKRMGPQHLHAYFAGRNFLRRVRGAVRV
jgi:hypothetical protein